MSTNIKDIIKDIAIDAGNLYREEMVTDLKLGSIQVLHPILPSGEPDTERETIYSCQTTLMTQMGSLPLQAKAEATTLEEAVEKFSETVEVALDELMSEAEKRQREEASRIVTPGEMGGMGGGGQRPSGGGGGGGLIV